MKKVLIASDHAGFDLKNQLSNFLIDKGWQIEDVGPKEYNQEDDYPDFATPLAQKVSIEGGKGIVLCANGQGVCIVANKIKGIRAVTATSIEMAKTTREDDDANVLCLPAKFLNNDEAKAIVKTWLETSFSGAERHKRRIKKVMDLE